MTRRIRHDRGRKAEGMEGPSLAGGLMPADDADMLSHDTGSGAVAGVYPGRVHPVPDLGLRPRSGTG